MRKDVETDARASLTEARGELESDSAINSRSHTLLVLRLSLSRSSLARSLACTLSFSLSLSSAGRLSLNGDAHTLRFRVYDNQPRSNMARVTLGVGDAAMTHSSPTIAPRFDCPRSACNPLESPRDLAREALDTRETGCPRRYRIVIQRTVVHNTVHRVLPFDTLMTCSSEHGTARRKRYIRYMYKKLKTYTEKLKRYTILSVNDQIHSLTSNFYILIKEEVDVYAKIVHYLENYTARLAVKLSLEMTRVNFANKTEQSILINKNLVSSVCAPCIKKRATYCSRNKKDFLSHLNLVCNHY
ncbi:hypothetical protein PUN28_004388 [Cardiocondyla obscurior]|uniref:Uncharacterized protein n=1 Tax=Cardiocondyla obscurior TaxID=286306 RepID=A0AAW2GCA4_9HYME